MNEGLLAIVFVGMWALGWVTGRLGRRFELALLNKQFKRLAGLEKESQAENKRLEKLLLIAYYVYDLGYTGVYTDAGYRGFEEMLVNLTDEVESRANYEEIDEP